MILYIHALHNATETSGALDNSSCSQDRLLSLIVFYTCPDCSLQNHPKIAHHDVNPPPPGPNSQKNFR